MPFLPSRSKRCSCYPCNLWGYWIDHDHICTWCSYNIAIEYFWIITAIFSPVSERQPAKWKSFCPFCPNLVANCHGDVTWGIKKRCADRSSTNKYLSSGEKIAKISLADPEIICLRVIIKKRKKLTEAKYIALPASLPSWINDWSMNRLMQKALHVMMWVNA